ncbi:MAG: hypothetical protein J7K58_00665, partial [Euryarchaeota archaeon]|nr:hypothetical protein [Euryarchaeota archaeon]
YPLIGRGIMGISRGGGLGKSPREELVEGFIEIVTSFTARIYGKRSHKAKKLLEVVLNELKGD